ncbi:MAG: hypothetical protein M3Q24_02295 [bacterium]|nr:hypothetical protein [bacterium]
MQDYGTIIADDVCILMGFGGFTFQSSVIREEGKSAKTEISIWYHPQRKEPMPGSQSVSVADISFDGEMYSNQEWKRGKEFQVHEGWQKELKGLIANQLGAVKDYENGGHIPSAPIQIARNSEAEEAERVQRGKEFRSRITSPLTLVSSKAAKSA